MSLQTEAAAPIAVGSGGGNSKASAAANYRTITLTATEIASAVIAERFGIPPHLARLVCELAGMGGEL